MPNKGTLICFERYLVESLKDSEEAQGYLAVSLEEYAQDKNIADLLDAVHLIDHAKGGVLKLDQKKEAAIEVLHKLFKKTPTPQWQELLEALGYVFVAN